MTCSLLRGTQFSHMNSPIPPDQLLREPPAIYRSSLSSVEMLIHQKESGPQVATPEPLISRSSCRHNELASV
jgi:hypothetical protein